MNSFEPNKKILNNDKQVISVRISTAIINQLDKLAGEIDTSRNEIINQCIKYALDNLKKD